MRGIHRSSVNSPRKGQWRGALVISLICAWINGWVNNREAGDLRHHRIHYDVTGMQCLFSVIDTHRLGKRMSVTTLKSLSPSEAMWRCKTWPTLIQIMTCYLMAPSITWINLDQPSVRSCGIHLKAISQEIIGISTRMLDMRIEDYNPICKRRMS